jgi:hypothetical protein
VTTGRFIANAPTTEAVPTGTASPSVGIAESDADGDICRTCGACCSYSADWPRFSLESESHLARIPAELIDHNETGMRCNGRRCAALVGVVGRSTSCAIYPLRPDVCHACVPGDAACREARAHFGL